MRRIAEHKRKIWKAMEHTIGMRIPLFLAFLILTLVPLLVHRGIFTRATWKNGWRKRRTGV